MTQDQSGFYHNFPKDSRNEKYVITGTVKNIDAQMINRVELTAKFYDMNNNYLGTTSKSKNNLPSSYTWDFKITYNRYSNEYFNNIEKVDFELSP